jgi:hypothetical protein
MTDDGNPKLVIAPYVCHIIFNQVQRWDLMDKKCQWLRRTDTAEVMFGCL